MALEGDLNSVVLPKVLQSISAQRSNGILTIQGEEDIVAVSFLAGGVVAADALNQTVEEGLGDVLQSQNLVSAEDFKAIARDHQGGGSGSLGDLLVERGLVSREELLQGLRMQTYRLMLQVLTWRQGEFKFYGGDEVSYEEGFVPIPVDELLIRSIDDLGEAGGVAGPVPELDSAYRQVPPRSSVQVMGRDGDGGDEGIWITEEQELFLSRSDGTVSAAELARKMGLPRYKALFTLYNLLQHDLIEPLGRVAPAAPPKLEIELPEEVPNHLRAEIFKPPEPAPGTSPAPAAAVAERPVVKKAVAADRLHRWIGPALAAVLIGVLVLSFLRYPGRVLLPFPWQTNQRSTVEQQLRQSLFQKIDRAAKAYFLVQAHYPDSLADLVELGLLSEVDLRDPAGYTLSYSTNDVSYTIELLDDGKAVEGLGTSEAITGDFLLDSQFFHSSSQDEKPLYLID